MVIKKIILINLRFFFLFFLFWEGEIFSFYFFFTAFILVFI